MKSKRNLIKIKMEQESLRHAKKHWHKGGFYFKSIIKGEFILKGVTVPYVEVEMYISDRSIVMNCYNNDVITSLNMALPKEKIKVWFSTESRKHNDKWYTNNTIKHVEIPRLIQISKMKEAYMGGNGFNFAENNEDF